jgi:hypothetical protein
VIYKKISVNIFSNLALAALEDDDDYKTAGIDEVEFEIKDLVRLQKANARSSGTYDDILTSTTNTARRHMTPRLSTASSSSTLNNLIPAKSQYEQVNVVSGEEDKQETVTETIKTQQIQTTFHQIGQHLDDSAFFIPLTSSSTHYEGQQNQDGKILIPVSTSTIRHEEQPALHYNQDKYH